MSAAGEPYSVRKDVDLLLCLFMQCLCSVFVVLVRGSQVEKVLEFQMMVVVVLLENHPWLP